eukprot:TRINITY_DN970_c0_g2_i1.p1 TRINITY_DN970_c0_g2~~TRINITY_DN970_c0_g2_i1.p1  ORF type:complete len:2340 (+),score=198.18 TRINITY_DN970_c0_g2_i1:69-7088(+)
MKAKQIVPGAIGLPPQTTRIVRARIMQADILSYGSMSKVIVLSPQLVVLQSIDVGSENVRALAWQPRTGQLAVACGHDIVIFRVSESQPISADSNHLINLRMERIYTLPNDCLFDALAWEPKDGKYLLAGGTRLVLWEFRQGFLNRVSNASASSDDRRVIEEQLNKLFGDAAYRLAATLQADDPERPITHIAFSPDGAMFASIGLHDRCIKVWFHNSLTGFTFVYLPHARAVSDFEWRLPYTNQDFAPNVLLSRICDGSILLWEETPSNQRMQFSLKLTLSSEPTTSAQWLFPPVYDLVDVIDEKSGKAVHGSELFSNRHCATKSIADRHTSYTLTNNPTETQDWIVGVQSDGSVLFWKVKGLGVPKQAPVANLYSVLKNVLSPTAKQDNYHQIVAIAQRFSYKNKIFHPSIVSLFASSASKRDISAWSVELSANRVATALARRCTGHAGSVIQLEAHPSLPLLASVDASGRVLVWKVADTTFSDTAFVLNDLCLLVQDDVPLITWDTQDSILYVHSQRGVSAFYIPVLEVLETAGTSFSQNAPSAVALAPIAASQPTPALTAIAPQVQPILIGYLARSSHGPLPAVTKIGALHFSTHEPGARSKESFIYAFNDGGKRLSVWQVGKPDLVDRTGLPVATPDEPITSRLLVDGEPVLSESQAVSCACPPASVELETSQSGIRSTRSCSLVTGGVDGVVRGWSFAMTANGLEVAQSFQFKAAEEPIVSVRSAFLGRIATRAKSSACIDVWESESHAPNFLLESSLKVLEQPLGPVASRARSAAAAFKPVVVSRVGSRVTSNSGLNNSTTEIKQLRPPSLDEISFDWLSLVSGGQLLAVTAAGATQLWCLRRSSDLFSFKPHWSRVDTFADEHTGGTSVVWTSLGQLVLARDEQLVVLSQWLDSNQGTIPRLVEDENKSLPFYHPKALVEYLMAGQLDRVHLILKHILSHFRATESRRRAQLKDRFLRSHSTVEGEGDAPPAWDNETEEKTLDQLDPSDPLCDFSLPARADDANVPPLPLNAFPESASASQTEDAEVEHPLVELTSHPAASADAPKQALAPTKESLFDDDPYENLSYDSWDRLDLSDGEDNSESPAQVVPESASSLVSLKDAEYIQPFEWNFETISSSDARRLSSRLAEVGLAALSPQEQLYLLALLDTLASLERSWVDMAAVRFALTIRYFLWMKKTNRLPHELREPSAGAAPNHTLASLSWCWAMHCHDQMQLINLCVPPNDNSACLWDNVRMFGIPLWCSDNTVLRQLADRLAKQHFLINRDPADCALFYILLGKRTALQTLYKTARDEKLAGFLSNDFAETRWREAALKNAYALLGKQRYHLAVAFFLLGSSIRDAITVCLSNLNDWMLALFVARLMDGDNGEIVREIFSQHVLPKASLAGDLSLLSAAHWFLHDYRRALTSLVPASEPMGPRSISREFNPGILHLFSFLSKHPRIKLLGIQVELDSLRRSLESMAVFAYMRSGLSRLALQSDAMHPRAQTSVEKSDLTSDIEAGLHRRALLQHITKELEHTRVNNAMELGNFMTDLGFLSQAFSVSQTSLLTPLLQYCESRLLLKSNYLLLRSQDEKLAARFLIRSAKRIIPICLSLVTYPLSTHHARGIHRFTIELHECLALHSSLPAQHTLSASASNLSSSGSAISGPFSKQARAAMEASIRLGLFLAAWSVGDYDVLLAIIVELGGASWPQSGISRLLHPPGNLDQLIEACVELRPSPLEAEGPEKLEPDTRMFLRGLFHLLLLYKFICLLEESLAKNGFQQPGQLNMIRTLRHWLFTAESTLNDIPNQIVRERFSEILHSKSKSVFDFAFFDYFAKLGPSFATSSPCRKHLWDTFGRDEGVIAQYLQKADFLKQGMRFVRLLHDLRADFDEEVQKHAGTRLSVELERYGSSGADLSTPSTDVRDILLDIDSRLRRSPSPSPRSPSPASSQGEVPSDTDSAGSFDSATLGDLVSDASFLPVRPLPQVPVMKRRAMAAADIRFGEPVVVFRDKDILQSFCINPTRSKQMAVATTHGISEIIVTSDAHSQTVLRRSSSEPELGTSAGIAREPREGASMTEDDKQDVANWIESHPTFPYYLSGSVDGSVRLWQFNVPQSLATYREKSTTRLTKLHFNWNGTKFAAADQSGNVQLWRFDANEDSTRPFVLLPCHTRRSADVVFLNSGSIIASAGESSGNKNVCIWDTLLPPARGEVASFVCQPDGATAMVYSPRWQLLICGGKQGNLSILDVRQRKIVQELDGHTRAIKDLSIDPSQNWMISGSNEGNVKIWDLSTLTVVDTWAEAHSRQTFVRNAAVLGAGPISTHGVMQVKFSRNHCYTCGSDGRLVQRRFEADSF